MTNYQLDADKHMKVSEAEAAVRRGQEAFVTNPDFAPLVLDTFTRAGWTLSVVPDEKAGDGGQSMVFSNPKFPKPKK